jgi:hypothetical protein
MSILVVVAAIWALIYGRQCNRKSVQFESRLEKLRSLVSRDVPVGTDKDAAIMFLDKNHIQHTPYAIQRHKEANVPNEPVIVGWVVDDTGCGGFGCNSRVSIAIDFIFDENGKLTKQSVQPSFTCL